MRVLLADSDPSSKCCCRDFFFHSDETHSLEPFSCLARAKFLLHAETTAICIKTEAFYLFDHEMGSKQRRNISFCPKISSKAKNIKVFPYWDTVSVSFSAPLSHSCNIILKSKVSPSSPSITQHVTCLTCCLLTLPISVPLQCSLLFFSTDWNILSGRTIQIRHSVCLGAQSSELVLSHIGSKLQATCLYWMQIGY